MGLTMSLIIVSVFLVLLLIILPIGTYFLDEPPNDIQLNLIKLNFYIAVGFSVLCFILGEISKSWSQVDKVWSITPFIYSWVITYKTAVFNNGNYDERQVLISLLVTLWGLRLTG